MDSKPGKQQTNGCETDNVVSPNARVSNNPQSVSNHAQLARIERQAMKSAAGGSEGGSRNSRQHHHPISNARPRRHSPAMVPVSPPAATGGSATGLTTLTPSVPTAAGGMAYSGTALERRITRHSPPSSATGGDRDRTATTKSQKSSHGPGFTSTNQSPTKRGAQNSATLIPGAVASHQHNLQQQQLAAGSGAVLSQAPVLAKRSQPTPTSIVSSLAEITPLSNAKSSLSGANSTRHHYHGSQSSHHHHYHRDHAHTAVAPSSNVNTPSQPATAPSSASSTPSAATSLSINTNLPSTSKRKRVSRQKVEAASPPPLSPSSDEFVRASKRVRLQHQPFQSPSPASVIPAILRHTSTPQLKQNTDEKILVFQRGDFLAVRNENGGFFVCRTAQNVYKSSKRFKIQWMNNDKKPDLYTPDFYDHTDFECILTNLRMKRADKSKYLLPKDEQQRTENILQRALNVENGMDVPDPLAVSKDGVDVSFVGKEEEEEVAQQQKKQKLQESTSKIKQTPRSTSRSSRVTSGSSAISNSSSSRTSTSNINRGRGRPRKPSERISKANAKATSSKNKKAKIPSAVMKVRAKARATARAKMKVTPTKAALAAKSKSSALGKRNQITTNHVGVVKSQAASRNRTTSKKKIVAAATPTPPKKKVVKVEKLQPNPKVIVFDKDPTFETNLPIPFISTSAHSRLLIRAVLLSDHTLLQALLADTKNVCSLTVARSIHVSYDAYTYAILREDHQLIRALLKAKKRNYAKPPDILLTEDDTGRPNYHMFGHYMRNVNVSRGGREGNNALLKDQDHYSQSYPSSDDQTAIKVAVQNGISLDTLDILCEGDSHGTTRSLIYRVIVDAVRNGHRKLAGQLVKEAFEKGGYGFNALHTEVLLFEDQPLSKFKSVSVIKKPMDNARITPLHCAAINPNPKYLAALLAVTGTRNIKDKNGWEPIHYAAVCESPGPLKLLLSKGVMLTEVENNGNTPLHLACRAGRLANVDLILKNQAGHKLDDDEKHKYTDLPNKNTYTPLHLAAENGHTDVVKKLLQFQVDPEKTLSANQDKMTALMLAAQKGHFNVVNTLIQNGAKVEAKDKKQRTALTHAIMDGHAHVASYLLRLGADPNAADSSGNTLVHYAAAYGWYFCLKLLAEAGASIHQANEWKLTPLSVAFVKGHIGLVDFLLSQPGADINVSVDVEDGKTLLMQTVRARLTPSMMERVRLLIEKFQCDCVKVDAKGNNALHHFVQSEVKHRELLHNEELGDPDDERQANLDDPEWSLQQEEELKMLAENQNEHDMVAEKIAGLLLRNGCGAQVANSEGETPFTLAVKQGSLVLVKEFMKAGCVLSPGHVESADETILHSLVRQAAQKDVITLYKAILDSPNETCPRQVLLMMAQSYNREGYTPLLLALKLLSTCKQVESHVCLIHLIRSLLKDLESDISKVVKKPQEDSSSALHLAAMCEERTAMELILAEKPTTLDVLDSSGRTPLLVAIKHGNRSVAEALIVAGANPNIRSPADNNLSALLLAAKNPKLLGVVELLAKSKTLKGIAEVNPVDGNNALHSVVVHQFPEVIGTVKALVEVGGIDINCINNDKRTALHLAVNANSGLTDAFFGVEEYLLSRKAKTDLQDNRGRIPLHYAFLCIERPDETSHHDPIELVTLLAGRMEGPVDVADHFTQTPLHCAAIRGATICCLHLCQKMKNFDPRDIHGNTPLGYAVLNGHEGCALMLLQRGANCMADVIAPPKGTPKLWQWHYLEARKAPKRPQSVLKEAINRDWQGILFLMLDQLEATGKGLTLAIQAALQCQKYQLALKLISRVKHGWTLYSEKNSMLHTLAMEAHPGVHEDLQLKVAQALLDKGIPPMARDEHGCSPIIYAAINWNHVLCHFFTEMMGKAVVVKLDPDKSHRTPFSALFWNLGTEDFPKNIKAWCLSLLEAGASPNVLTAYPIRESPYPGVSCLLTHNLYEEPGSNLYGATRLSPLMRSVYAGNLDVARFLLAHGAHVDFCDDLQRTPLMHAARINNLKMVKLLLNTKYNPEEENRAYSDANLRKTSDADLSRQDKQGWTVVHHAVAPLPTYSYVATSSLLELLARLGAPLDTADISGLTPKRLAAGRGSKNLVDTLETLLKVAPENKVKVAVESFTATSDNVPPIPGGEGASTDDKKEVKTEFDFRKDCSLALKAVKVDEQPERYIPDPKSGFTGVGEVVMDPVHNVPYDVLLTNVELNYGNFGIYNYYKMQVIRHPARDLIILFTNWGRVGDYGQHQKTPYSNLEEAVKEFAKIFKSKSGNSWENIKSFIPQPKKYRLVSLEKRKQLPSNKVKVNLTRKVPSKLPKSLEHLLWHLLNYKQLQLSIMEYSVPEKAFQQLSEENLLKAEKILDEIDQVIDRQSKVHVSNPYHGELMNEIVELSEEFFQLVPIEGYQYEKLTPLFTKSDVQSKKNILHNLLHLEVANELVIAASSKADEMNPADYVYRCLHCKLELLKPESHEAQLILQYIYNTASKKKISVAGIFRISREGETERLEASGLSNNFLLWHGTPGPNLLGILATGLRVAPYDAVCTSSGLFGQGIYFADMFEKSRHYSYDYDSSKRKPNFMLVCQVALGRSKEVTYDSPLNPEGCDSFKAVGRQEPDPTCSVTWKGVTVPLGPPVEISEPTNGDSRSLYRYLAHNEYVIQREEQVAVRYLVQFDQ